MDELWLQLINSDWHDYLGRGQHEDRLDRPEWVAGFLARWELKPNVVSSRDTRGSLRTLRAVLQRSASTLSTNQRLDDQTLDVLNAFLMGEPLLRRVERDRDSYCVHLIPTGGGIDAILAEIAASFAELLANGDPDRIKICENPDCKWMFYDRSRNRSRRWCEGPTGCGNLLKVRRHRERRKNV